jgi:L-fuconolactonase
VIRVDSHQHYWRLARADYGWLTPELGVLYRDYLPSDLAPELARTGVSASVVVQAAATEAETRFLLDLARGHSSIAAVVGWVEFEAPDVRERMRRLMRDGGGKLRGLRPMVQDIADPDWLARPTLDAAFEALIEFDLTFDALICPRHFGVLRQRLRRHPQLKSVLDHCGKPDIAAGGYPDWAEQIAALAQETPAFCKLSGLLTQAEAGADADELAPYVAQVLESFGANRVMWGSDWPVHTSSGSYVRWFELAQGLVRRHAPEAEAAVFGGNAVRFYALDIGH